MTRLGEMWTWEWKIEPRDCWIGLFWDRKQDPNFENKQWLHLYICFLPCLVLHGTCSWHYLVADDPQRRENPDV